METNETKMEKYVKSLRKTYKLAQAQGLSYEQWLNHGKDGIVSVFGTAQTENIIEAAKHEAVARLLSGHGSGVDPATQFISWTVAFYDVLLDTNPYGLTRVINFARDHIKSMEKGEEQLGVMRQQWIDSFAAINLVLDVLDSGEITKESANV